MIDKISKQTVYLPVSDFNSSERAICTIGIPDLYGDKVEEKEGYFFLKEQLNKVLSNLIKDTLNTVANKGELVCGDDIIKDAYGDLFWIDEESITNLHDEIFEKFKVK